MCLNKPTSSLMQIFQKQLLRFFREYHVRYPLANLLANERNREAQNAKICFQSTCAKLQQYEISIKKQYNKL